MTTFNRRLEQYFLKNSSWIFITVILAFSYVVIQVGNQPNWDSYMRMIGGSAVLFLPTLIWVAFRESFIMDLSKGWRLLLGTFIFILLPVIYYYLEVYINRWPFSNFPLLEDTFLNQTGILILAGAFLMVELLLTWTNKERIRGKLSEWFTKLAIPRLAFVVVLILTGMLLLSSNAFQSATKNLSGFTWVWTFISFWIQLFILYFSYYLIYHIHHHFLFNKILKQKGLLYYLLGIIGLVLLLGPLYTEFAALFPVTNKLSLHVVAFTADTFDVVNYIIPIIVIILSLPIIIILEWYKNINSIHILEKEKSEAELSLLKQQINPHFFFNTLNNLYAMSLTQEADTPKTILQLSDLMRYVIYKGKEKKVKLRDEIRYIKDYIDLQKVRIHRPIDFQLEVNLPGEEIELPPLLFIIPIENAFKHGIEPASESAFLHISLNCSVSELVFTCHNSIEPLEEDHKPGIGLKNLRRRLDILFPNRHTLDIMEQTDDYKLTLTISL